MTELNEELCKACSSGPPDWRYRCRECGHEFVMPAPKGPKEERGRTCPNCKSRDIERIDIIKSEACPPGG